jgi:hypothetical protein
MRPRSQIPAACPSRHRPSQICDESGPTSTHTYARRGACYHNIGWRAILLAPRLSERCWIFGFGQEMCGQFFEITLFAIWCRSIEIKEITTRKSWLKECRARMRLAECSLDLLLRCYPIVRASETGFDGGVETCPGLHGALELLKDMGLMRSAQAGIH